MKPKLLLFSIFLFPFSVFISYAQTLDWAIGMGSTDVDGGIGVGVDALGNVYTCGTFNGTVDFDPGVNTVNLSAGSYTSVFIQKTDADGNFLWAKRIVCATDMLVGALHVDSAGNTYITGSFNSTTNFNSGGTNFFISTAGEKDAFIAKYNTDGTLAWAKAVGGVNDDLGRSIFVDNAGNTYATGTFTGTIDADPGNGTLNFTNVGLLSVYILKLDANGDLVWAVMNSKANAAMQPFSIEADNAGNVYVAGAFLGTMDFDPSGTSYDLTSTSNTYDICIQKLDQAGNFLWAKQAGSTGLDYCHSIALGEFNDIYLTGFFNNTVDFDPGNGISNLTSAGGNDIFILKLDIAGNYKWAKRMGSTGGDFGRAVCYQSGEIYSVGSFYNTVDFNPNAGTDNFTASNNYSDYYIQILDTTGNYVWTATFGSTANDEAFGVYGDHWENKYITGRFNGTFDFDPGPNTSNLVASTGTSGDIFVQKLTDIVTSVDTDFNDTFNLYPNPASNFISIQSAVDSKHLTITIYNAQGQLVTLSKVEGQKKTIDISSLSSGIYYLHLQSNDGVGVKKFEVLR